MSGSKKRSQGRRRKAGKLKAADLWRPVPLLPPAEPIEPAAEPTTLVRSLGAPPLQGQGAAAEHNVAMVVQRAAELATALAASVDLVAESDRDEPVGS